MSRSNHVLGSVLFDNRLTDSGVTITYTGTEQAGFQKEYSIDWFDWTVFRPQQGATKLKFLLAADGCMDSFCWFVHAEDFTLGGYSLKLSYESVPSVFTQLGNTIDLLPGNSLGKIVFPAVSVLSGRTIEITITIPPTDGYSLDIKMLCAGMELVFPIGQYQNIKPPGMQRSRQFSNSMSVTGSVLGRTISREGFSGNIELEYLSEDWVNFTWLPFVDHAQQLAFFYAWDFVKHPLDISYAWATGFEDPVNTGPGTLKRVAMTLGILKA